MDMVTLITIIAIVAVIAAVALFMRKRGGTSDDDYDDAEYDDYDEDEVDEDAFDDENEGTNEDSEDMDEDDENHEYDEDEYEYDEDEYENDDEYDVEELPLETYKATVVGMDIERRQTGSSKRPSSHLEFLVEFKIQKSRNKSEIITLDVPEDIYSDISLGENALLVVQGKRFIDFGDRYAEDADEEDIKAAEKKKATENKKTKK